MMVPAAALNKGEIIRLDREDVTIFKINEVHNGMRLELQAPGGKPFVYIAKFLESIEVVGSVV